MSKKYLGVYSTVETSSNAPGPASQSGQTVRKRYWYAWEWDTGTVLVQGADDNLQPTGQPRILVYAVFDSRFSRNERRSHNLPEPPLPALDNLSGQQSGSAPGGPTQFTQAVSVRDVSKAFRDVSDTAPPAELISSVAPAPATPAPAEQPAQKQEEPRRNYYSLEELKLAEDDASTSFWNGFDLFESGRREEAMRGFERPLLISAPWQRKHKHMFSDFGITLRKIKVAKLALRYHNKALSLAPDEPNILFNLARVHLSLGDLSTARTCVLSVLAKRPDSREALALKDYIDKNR